jgi:hypothetical protein
VSALLPDSSHPFIDLRGKRTLITYVIDGGTVPMV